MGTASEVRQPSDVDALNAFLLARYGDRLDDAQAAKVREMVERSRQTAAILSAYPLTNADEPDASFRAVSGADRV